MKRWIWTLCLFPLISLASGTETFPLQHVQIDQHDQASLQRGAKWYMNYCSGCHSLKYARYKRIAKDLGIIDYEGNVDEQLMKENLIFTGAKIGDTGNIAMPPEDAKEWFGKAPPDLTLVARVRGKDWLYTYLTSFYADPTKQWGTNNAVFPDVAMPNVFAELQGIQKPVMNSHHMIEHLEIVKEGTMSDRAFDNMVKDLVNFLVYVGEPAQNSRRFIGIFVLIFVGIFTVCAYLLKKEYWKDVK